MLLNIMINSIYGASTILNQENWSNESFTCSSWPTEGGVCSRSSFFKQIENFAFYIHFYNYFLNFLLCMQPNLNTYRVAIMCIMDMFEHIFALKIMLAKYYKWSQWLNYCHLIIKCSMRIDTNNKIYLRYYKWNLG
jgi:hypothetical protein